MAIYTARLDFGTALETPDLCPGCGRPGLEAMLGTETPIFRCPACAGYWRFVLGRCFSADPQRAQR